MAMKPKISDFDKRVTLLNKQWTTDEELNRIEHLCELRDVWAIIEVKNSSNETTISGERPVIQYRITLRKTEKNFTHIRYKGEVFELTAPAYDIAEKFTVFDAIKTDDKKRFIIKQPQIVGDF